MINEVEIYAEPGADRCCLQVLQHKIDTNVNANKKSNLLIE